ncbi:hypothetical protein MKX03_019217 [Papaver bracteatum]|nr:hypothetical protein MKX03_019217 [Papaver bracteatum]
MVMTRSKTKLLRNENMDRISDLPDCLIQHILSFLPTECAVSTTVLSKRWNNLWIHVPILDFNHSNEEDSDEEDSDEKEAIWEAKANMFMDFVDSVLNHRKMLTIQKFCLTCDNAYFDDIRVKEWISAALKCKVEEMHLSVTWPYAMFPIGLFTSESLIKLHIYFLWNEQEYCTLDLQQPIYFPRLKILQLSSVIFEDEILVAQLFSNCPLLEDLCLIDCIWEDVYHINISAPSLKSFTLDNRELISKIEYAELKIDAPNLMSIKYYDWLPWDFIVDKFPSLVDVDLRFENTLKGISDFDSVFKFAMKLSNVLRLRLSSHIGSMEILGLFNVLSTSVPRVSAFESMIHLETGYSHADTVLKFLQFTPNLESLAIVPGLFNKVNEDAFTSNLVPSCLLLHLKTIEVREFEGQPEELKLVKYIWTNARILQVLIIQSGTSKTIVALEKKTQIMEMLLMNPRASTSCKVKFQFPK